VKMNFWSKSSKLMHWIIGILFAVFIASPCVAQKPAAEAPDSPGIVVTKQGPLAIDVPKGWSRVPGMGLAFFVPAGTDFDSAQAWIYLSSIPIGQKTDYADVDSYIRFDIAAFKEKYPAAFVQNEIPVVLRQARLRAQIYTFQSGDKNNAYEQVVYVGEKGRALMFNFSAKTPEVFQQMLPVFRNFVTSYKGSADTSSGAKKP
jgi:hypothetical protein